VTQTYNWAEAHLVGGDTSIFVIPLAAIAQSLSFFLFIKGSCNIICMGIYTSTNWANLNMHPDIRFKRIKFSSNNR